MWLKEKTKYLSWDLGIIPLSYDDGTIKFLVLIHDFPLYTHRNILYPGKELSSVDKEAGKSKINISKEIQLEKGKKYC